MQKNLNIHMVPLILALVVVGFVPVLTGNYVPQDQWRVFTYGLNIEGVDKWAVCANNRIDLFILTGRPLVWIPECIEHGFIQDIDDFKLLRLLTLIVVMTTLLICGFVFRAIAGGYWRAIYLSVPMVMAPGYAFMFYQGETAGGVLAAVALAVASAYFSNKEYIAKERILGLCIAGGLFLLALFNYASFAFIVFPVIFFCVFFEANKSLLIRMKTFLALCVFYSLLCIAYFVLAKLLSHLVPPQDLGQYQLSVNDASSVIRKSIDALSVIFENGSVINIYGIPYLGLVAMIGAAAFVPGQPAQSSVWLRILPSLVFILLFPAVAIFSSAPVILSNFEGYTTRHFFPSNFMIGFSAFMMLMRLSERYLEKSSSPVIVCFILLVMPASIAVQQYRISSDLIQDSAIEINAIRSSVRNLVKDGHWAAGKHIHVLRPSPGSFNRRFTWFNSGEYAPATTQNPSHIKEMLTMALREQLGQEEIRKIYFRDCRLELECGISPPNPFELVVTQSREALISVPWSTPYSVVDLSSLVRKEALP